LENVVGSHEECLNSQGTLARRFRPVVLILTGLVRERNPMHGAIWKLSALATVVGFGLLAVVLQQKGLGKSPVQAAAGSGEETPPEGGASQLPDGEPSVENPQSTESTATQQSDAAPTQVKIKTVPRKPTTEDNGDIHLTPPEDDAAEFPSRKTSPRTAAATTGKRAKNAPSGAQVHEAEPQEAAEVAPPQPLKTATRGRRTAPAEVTAFEGDENAAAAGVPQPPAPHNQAKAVAGKSAAGHSSEDAEADPLDRLKNRGPRQRGRPDSGSAAQHSAPDEAMAQAPNTHSRADSAFAEDQPQTQSRTAPRSGAGPSPRNKRPGQYNPSAEAEGGHQAVAPTAAEVIDETPTPPAAMQKQAQFEGPDHAGAMPRGRAKPKHSALIDGDDELDPRHSQPGNARKGTSAAAHIKQSGSGSAADADAFPQTSPRSSQAAGQDQSTTGADLQLTNPQQEQHSQELSTTPPVPLSRNRAALNADDENISGRAQTAPRNNGQQRPNSLGAPQPIPKLERQPAAEPDASEIDLAPRGPASRNGRRRPGAFDDDDAGTSQAPPSVPVAKQQFQNGSNAPTDRGSAAGQNDAYQGGTFQGNDPNNPAGAGQPDQYNGSINPITGQPETPGRVIRVPQPNQMQLNQPQFPVEQPGAAASGNSATDVVAPRPVVAPGPTLGAVRGRARVTIEKIAPPTAVLGQPLVYSILIRNTGNAPAKQVVVEDIVPEGVTMQGSFPQAEMTGQKLKWQIGNLDVGQEQKISVKVVPNAEGPIGSAATVNFVHDFRMIPAGADANGEKPVLLELQYPPQVSVGELFEVKFRLTNRTNLTLTKLNILCQLPIGLQHETQRQDLQKEVAVLGPGERMEVTLTLTAAQAGAAASRAVVLAADESILESRNFSVNVRNGSR
jgi:uncharacterized repeat protein (TIGR01451 family)